MHNHKKSFTRNIPLLWNYSYKTVTTSQTRRHEPVNEPKRLSYFQSSPKAPINHPKTIQNNSFTRIESSLATCWSRRHKELLLAPRRHKRFTSLRDAIARGGPTSARIRVFLGVIIGAPSERPAAERQGRRRASAAKPRRRRFKAARERAIGTYCIKSR